MSDLALADLGRPATPSELSTLYGQLPAAVPTVVYAGDPPDADATARVHRLGFDVSTIDELDTGAYVLGGPLHGWCVRPDALLAQLERARLREWAASAAPVPSLTRWHKPGSDSRGVAQFISGGAEMVAKIGPAAVILAEVRFVTGVNAVLAKENLPGLFPEVHGVRVEGEQAVSVMAAGTPLPISPLFADDARTTLRDEAVELLEPHLTALGAWYRLTTRPGRPTVADYLYRERYPVLRRHPDFRATFRTFFGDLPPATLLDAPVRLPGGEIIPGYTAASAWLAKVAPALLPNRGSAVHGDIYAANMLTGADGRPLLIDPRTVWEGRDRPDVGYGDPVFDLSTLLHGVLPMAAILRAVEDGDTARLWSAPVDPRAGVLDLSGLTLPTRFPAAVEKLTDRLLDLLPPGETDRVVRTRLYIGAATSLAGWLKYPRSLGTAHAWLATYAYTAWYLWQARQVWQGGPHDHIGL